MSKLTKAQPWLSGEPYYCKNCGLGFAEYVACEEVNCELESKETAMNRKQLSITPTGRAALKKQL